MRSVHDVQRRPLFIPFCLLALAWLAHHTFLGSPLPNNMPKILPPFIRCRSQGVLLALSWSAARTFMGSPMRIPVDVPKIVPPFIVRRRVKCFRIMGSNRREDVCING